MRSFILTVNGAEKVCVGAYNVGAIVSVGYAKRGSHGILAGMVADVELEQQGIKCDMRVLTLLLI